MSNLSQGPWFRDGGYGQILPLRENRQSRLQGLVVNPGNAATCPCSSYNHKGFSHRLYLLPDPGYLVSGQEILSLLLPSPYL
jgi:hypothetical protein